MRTPRFIRLAAVLTAGALVLSACTGGDGDDGSGEDAGAVAPLTIHANTANTYQQNFNPFSPTALQGTKGMLYEPLMIATPMVPGEAQPWLAESMDFNEDGTVVTFVLREGVAWSDGEAFDADDVAFTFNLMRDNPAANAGALDLAEAVATDPLTVEVTFNSVAFAFQASIANTVMVPEHVFADVDPVEFQNEEPVATGPFVLEQFGQQLYTLSANEGYWNADEVEVEQVRYPASSDQTFNSSLQAGEFDWSGGFVANIDQIYVSGDPEHRSYWYPGDGLVNLLVNTQTAPFDDVAVRQALSAGIDRDQLSEVAMQGYTPAAHPTGLPLPAYESVMSEEYADAEFSYDVDEANAILDEAGYVLGSDGVRTTPAGERMSYALQIPSSYVDWVTMSGLLQEQLAKIGVVVEPQGVSFEAWLEARNSGNYQMTIASVAMGLTPYTLFRSMMSSEYETGPGETVVSNYNRYYDDEADALLESFAATSDPEEQQAAFDGLEQIMVEQLPVIAMLQSPNWFQYNTARWEGFPTEEDPYALGAPFQFPDNLLVVTNLTPAG
ncbi:ABC transporter substrate-binding protein [Occultella aeris]|uniref:Heme-binding protein A n=1 Tax=Occultella aeris TaxID=2761496 RepID=A0A7M4DG37_9MICO|nr:ABC transporter substrate-binding protein [Occultella aeris]VZO35880.1 Heme-binding protein A precursor [Occultella aeris]